MMVGDVAFDENELQVAGEEQIVIVIRTCLGFGEEEEEDGGGNKTCRFTFAAGMLRLVVLKIWSQDDDQGGASYRLTTLQRIPCIVDWCSL